MFHQMRVDGGKEFYLCLGMQEIYSHLRSRQDIRCYQQTQSKKVTILLRFLLALSSSQVELSKVTC